MATVVVSDLHLGIRTGRDVAREGEPRERLLAGLADAKRVVLLGDLVELRERPLVPALDSTRPFFQALGDALAGKPVVLVPGNHDHLLAEPWLARQRLDGRPDDPGREWPVRPGDGPAGRLAEWMPEVELTLAYPGLWLRDDVYATHGHYLDVHLTVPRLESIAASAMARISGRRRPRSAEDHEAVLAPMYAFHFSFAQGAAEETLLRGSTVSRSVWRRANRGSDRPLARLLLGRVTIPGAVAALNRLGVGPFRPDLSGEELRRSGLRAMAEVVDGMEIDAEHVIFGHTHRPGPQERDDPREWRTPAGRRLVNSGSWLREDVFLGERPERSPYYPGTIVRVPDEGAPEVMNLLLEP